MTLTGLRAMAQSQNGRILLLGAVAVILTVASIGGWITLATSRDTALAAAQGLDDSQRLAGQIDRLRGAPSLAAGHELQQSDVTERIEYAARAAQMSANQVVRIWPASAHRLGQSPYKEVPTQVLLHNMTLRQMIIFLHSLARSGAVDKDGSSGTGSANGGALQVKSLRMTAPREGEQSGAWNVEATFSYFVFDPARSLAPVVGAAVDALSRDQPAGGTALDARRSGSATGVALGQP